MASVTVKLEEPQNCDYIFVDPKTNQVYLLLPIVGGSDIGLDNTCQTVKELLEFFGKNARSKETKKSARHQLERYKTALENDIALLEENGVSAIGQKERLKQINYYLAEIKILENDPAIISALIQSDYPKFPENILNILKGSKTNLLGMHLSPKNNDIFLNHPNPLFSLNRNNGGLGASLRNAFNQPREVLKLTPQELLVKRANEKFSNPFDSTRLEELRKFLIQEIKKEFEQDVTLNEELNHNLVNLDYFENSLGYDGTENVSDYANALLTLCLPSTFWSGAAKNPLEQTSNSLFDQISDSSNDDEKLSIMTQFFCALVNFHCFSNNISKINFGKILDNDPIKSAIGKAVLDSLKEGTSVEDNLIAVFNQYGKEFGLNHLLTHEDAQKIKNDFSLFYQIIAQSPHFDEFMVLMSKKGDYVYYKNRISFNFSQFYNANHFSLEASSASSSSFFSYGTEKEGPEKFFEKNQMAFDKMSDQMDTERKLFKPEDKANFTFDIEEALKKTNDPDKIARIILFETDKGKKVFETLSPEAIQILKDKNIWPAIRMNANIRIHDKDTLEKFQKFNMTYTECDDIIHLDAEHAEILYQKAKETSGEKCLESNKNTDNESIKKITNAIAEIGINDTALTITPSLGNGYIITGRSIYINAIRNVFNVITSMKLTPEMVNQLYRAVANLYGSQSDEYLKLMKMTNDSSRHSESSIKFPMLMQAFSLLQIGCEKIEKNPAGGYQLKIRMDESEKIKGICENYRNNPPAANTTSFGVNL